MKYLTHQLSQCKIYGADNIYDYKCDICGVYLLKNHSEFYLITDNGNNVKLTEFVLTCDEVIIKKIIE